MGRRRIRRKRAAAATTTTESKEEIKDMPSVKVYLGGLPEGTTEERLRDLFESQRLEAELSEGVRIKKGYAFAVFADEDRAKEAIAKLNGYVFNGVTMVAEIAKDSERKDSSCTLQLSKVPSGVTQKTLEPELAKYGKVESIEFTPLQEGEDRTVTVTYQKKDEADEAVKNLNNAEFGGATIEAKVVEKVERKSSSTAASRKGGGPALASSGASGTGHPGGSGGAKRVQAAASATVVASVNSSSSSGIEFPLRILVQSEMVGAIIGRGGQTIRQITQQSRARVDVHRKENVGSVEKAITIFGQPESCSNACLQILKVVQEEARNTGKADDLPLKILAHNNLVGRIIGKQGSTIKKIMEETDTKITVSSIAEISNFNMERVITIRGDVEAMGRAEAEVSSKLRQAYENDVQAMNSHAMYSSVGLHPSTSTILQQGTALGGGYNGGGPSMSHHGVVMAGGGGGGPATGHGMMAARGATGNVAQNHMHHNHHQYYGGGINGGSSSYMGNGKPASGSADSLAMANLHLGAVSSPGGSATLLHHSLLASQHHHQHLEVETCHLYVPNSYVGAIIGAKGSFIKTMMKYTGANVKVAPDSEVVVAAAAPVAARENGANAGDDEEGVVAVPDGGDVRAAPSKAASAGNRKVTIVGAAESQMKAQYLIFEKLFYEGFAPNIAEVCLTLEVAIPASQVGRIIGKGGSNVRELQRLTKALIKLPEQGTSTGEETPVQITGTFWSCQSARRKLKVMVEAAMSGCSISEAVHTVA